MSDPACSRSAAHAGDGAIDRGREGPALPARHADGPGKTCEIARRLVSACHRRSCASDRLSSDSRSHAHSGHQLPALRSPPGMAHQRWPLSHSHCSFVFASTYVREMQRPPRSAAIVRMCSIDRRWPEHSGHQLPAAIR